MDKIWLSNDEKKVFWLAMRNQPVPPLGMSREVYFASVFSLHRKGLIEAKFNFDEVESISRTQLGEAYFTLNPSLSNPVDWNLVTAISTAVTAVIALAALILQFV